MTKFTPLYYPTR